ncbi:MAG: DUF4330 domain-containing protein [Ruminococcaceae bacterium]|nr:DUF4330 domain-containing protein [Oscillospiraceae bacterium]
MIINKEGKLFGKISIIDILVVIAIVIAALGIYSRFFVAGPKVETASSRIEYTMKIREVRIGTVEALNNFKGPVTDTSTKEYLGEIVDVTYTDSVKAVELSNGKLKASVLPERYDITVTVQVDGKVNDSGYYTANNLAITAGSSYVFTSKAAKTTGTIIDVYEVE